MKIPSILTKLLILVISLPVAFLVVMVGIVPAVFLATADRVHPVPAAVPAIVTMPADAREAFAAGEAARLARALASSENLPGLSVAVGIDGRLAWTGAFGFADVEERIPVTPETRFRIGGVSKPLTAAAVGLLVAQGKLDLDAPVQRYVPTFPNDTITTRQAMAHTSGLRHSRNERDFMTRVHCERPEQAFALFAKDPLMFPPGTNWRYSSYGWTVVSAVVEAAARRPFADYMRTEVFTPLGMHGTQLDDVIRDVAHRALPYWPRAKMDTAYGLEHPDESDPSCFFGSGNFLSTPSDLVRFGLAMQSHQLLDVSTTSLLESAVVLPSGQATGYGLGWFTRRVPFGAGETRVLDHPGHAMGGATLLARYPEQGIVIAVASNVTFVRLDAYAAQVAALFAMAKGAKGTAAAREPEGKAFEVRRRWAPMF